MKCVICKTKDAKHDRGYCGWCARRSDLGDLIITLQGIDELTARIKRLEEDRLEGVVKIKATEVVNENISAELGIPDRKDIITISCVGPSHDGQWVRRSSYNELSDEMQRRTKQLNMALRETDTIEASGETLVEEDKIEHRDLFPGYVLRDVNKALVKTVRTIKEEWFRDIARAVNRDGEASFDVTFGVVEETFVIKRKTEHEPD